MKNRQAIFLAGIPFLWLIGICGARLALCQTYAQTEGVKGVKCVKREAVVEPPRPSLPTLRPVDGKGQEWWWHDLYHRKSNR